MITEEEKLIFQQLTKENLNSYLISACRTNQLDVIEYLLTSSELKAHADIHVGDDYVLRCACYNGHLEVIKYLLTSPQLIEHGDIHNDNDKAFTNACDYKNVNIITYLILDYGIEKTENIEQYLIKNNRKDIMNMFDKKRLETALQHTLIKNNKCFNKIKL